MMPLSLVPPGREVRLVSIHGGDRMKKRLADLGLNTGMTVRVVSETNKGPVILAVKDSRLALGRGLLHRILVEDLCPDLTNMD